jgi:predicted PurR-regulated permease PerM
MDKVIDQNRIRQIFFIIVMVLLGLLLFRELYTFVPAVLGAITLYILMHNWMLYLTEKKKWKKGLAVLFLMFASFLVILLPIALLVNMTSSKITYAVQHSSEIIESVKTVINNIEQKIGRDIVSEEDISKLSPLIAQTLPKILGATFNTLTTVFFMYFILYFMLMNARSMENMIYEYIPLRDENVKRIGKEVESMVVSNAIGIPLIAVLQGIVGLIGYLILGVQEPWFWFVVTCITAMIPVVGAALAYVPLAIVFFANGQNWQGIAMLAFGFGIIGLVDNVFRFWLQKKIGNIHPLVTVFGVIIGIKLFGFIGLIFGPLLISMFILLLKIYSNEFLVKKRDLNKIMEN